MKSKRHWKTSSFGFAFILQSKGVSDVTWTHVTFISRCAIIIGEGFFRLGIFSNIFPFSLSKCSLWLGEGGFDYWFVLIPLANAFFGGFFICEDLGLSILFSPPFWVLCFLWLASFKISIDCTMEANYLHIP